MSTELLSDRAGRSVHVPPAGKRPSGPHCKIVFTGTSFVTADASLASPAAEASARRDEAIRHGGAVSWERVRATVADHVELTKPRIVVMILVTTVASAMIAAGGSPAASIWLSLLVGTAAIAGSAGAANQIWERKIDAEMTRTAGRPLPAGRVSPRQAIGFTALLGGFGFALLWVAVGPIPAVIGGLTWLLYVVAYTPMKTRTSWNTTVGAIAGALPILIGYTATGGRLGVAEGWLLFGVLAAWQYPHFMAIAWMYRRQYAAAGFQMTTTVDPSGRWAGAQSIVGSLVVAICGISLVWAVGGPWLRWTSVALVSVSCLPMLAASCRFAAAPGDDLARRLLRSSLLVLPAVLAIVTFVSVR